MQYLIEPLYNLIGNFGITIFLCVLVAVVILFPFEILKAKNSKNKKKAAPFIKEIQKKYNANILGVSQKGDDVLAPEIQKLSIDERDELMNKEILQVYKDVGYKAFTGWIPGVLLLVFIYLFYTGVSKATPDGFYGLTFSDIRSDIAGNINAFFCLLSVILASLLLSVVSQIKEKKRKKENKNDLTVFIVSVLFSTALMTWIASRVTVSIALTIVIFQIMNAIGSEIIVLKFDKNNNTKENETNEDNSTH